MVVRNRKWETQGARYRSTISYPRVYPAGVDSDFYLDDYTFNDGTHRDAVLLLLAAHARTGRERFRTAAGRAADFILLAQLPEPQPAGAQQYDAAMHPSWARVRAAGDQLAGKRRGREAAADLV